MVLISIICALLTQCKPANERRCAKSNGNVISERGENITNKIVQIEDDISLFLIQDSLNYYEIKGGENILPFVEITDNGGILTFKNENRCHFTRKRIPVQVFYHYTTLDSLYLMGFGDLTSFDTLYSNLKIVTFESYTSMNLTFNCSELSINGQVGSIEAIIKGKCDHFYMYSNGTGTLDASELVCRKAHGHSQGIGDMYLNAFEEINIELRSRGDFYITKTPQTNIIIKDEGEGEIHYE